MVNNLVKGIAVKNSLVAAFVLLAVASNSYGNEVKNSVSVHNLSNTEKKIWVNGEYFQVEAITSLWIPCLAEEKVEIQANEFIKVISCGEALEVSE